MPTTTATIEPRTKIIGTNHTDVQISANPWNQPRIVAGGSTGGMFVRDTTQSDGWGLVDAVAAGSVLVSAGVATLPAWSSSPTLTSITVGTINTSGGSTDLGSVASPFRAGYFSSFVAIGTNPSTTGALRLAYNGTISSRDSTNTLDIPLIQCNNISNVYIGGSGVTAERIFADTAQLVWNSSSQLLSGVDNTALLGLPSTRWAAGYLAQFLSIGTTTATAGALRLESTGEIRFGSGSFITSGATGLIVAGSAFVLLQAGAGGCYTEATKVYPTGDGALDLGGAANRWKDVYVSSSVRIGTNPAMTGAMRHGNNQPIEWRNQANTTDVGHVVVDNTDRLRIGANCGAVIVDATMYPGGDHTYTLGFQTLRWAKVFTDTVALVDGISDPGTLAGHAYLFVDSADGDLKVRFGDGTVKTIVVDT